MIDSEKIAGEEEDGRRKAEGFCGAAVMGGLFSELCVGLRDSVGIVEPLPPRSMDGADAELGSDSSFVFLPSKALNVRIQAVRLFDYAEGGNGEM